MEETSSLSLGDLINDTQKRDAHTIPKNKDKVNAPAANVYIHHPFYEDREESVFLPLPACSLNSKNEPCVEYLVAWMGAYAMAINQPGFLTRGRARDSEKVRNGTGLCPGDYYYHLDNGQKDYAMLLDARKWAYKLHEMPIYWTLAYARRENADEDFRHGYCAITGVDGGVAKCHNVVKPDYEQWMENNMAQHAAEFGVAIPASSDPAEMETGNIIHICDTLHRVWDNNGIGLVPLLCEDGEWRPHVIALQAPEMVVRLHHGRALQRGSVRDVAPCCAWMRFVHQIFSLYSKTFLSKQTTRWLGGSKTKARAMTHAQVLEHQLGRLSNTNPKSRSNSPKKRARTASGQVEGEGLLTIDSDGDSGYGEVCGLSDGLDGVRHGQDGVVYVVKTVESARQLPEFQSSLKRRRSN